MWYVIVAVVCLAAGAFGGAFGFYRLSGHTKLSHFFDSTVRYARLEGGKLGSKVIAEAQKVNDKI